MNSSKRNDANQNVWYVLMTLCGEQGAKFDSELAKRNLNVWNSWAVDGMDPDQQVHESRYAGWNLNDRVSVKDLEPVLKKEMLKRNGVKSEFPGLPSNQTPINMTELKFSKRLCVRNYIIPKAIDFYESEFEFPLNAQNINFLEIAKFQHCEFKDNAVFAQAKFQGTAEFLGTIFRSTLYATSANFSEFANFATCDFFMGAEFSDATFAGIAHFNEATFQGQNKTLANGADFSDASFEKPVSFRKAKFFHRYPKFAGAVFHDNSNFSAEDEFWPPLETAEPVNAKEFCARVRILLAKQGFSEEENQFFRREMAFSSRLGNWWRRLPYRVFGRFSNYGESIEKPVLYLFGLWLVPSLVLSSYFSWLRMTVGTVWNGWHAVGLSLSNIFTFFGFHRLYFDVEMIRALPGILQLMGACQTILALPLLFFLGLGLRTRFRLR